MDLYTVQLAQWRKVKARDIPLVDVTLKSGLSWLAPTAQILYPYKAGQLSDQGYTEQYYALLRQRYHDNPQPFIDFIHQDVVCIACYCTPGHFCHRHLLVDIFRKLCVRHSVIFNYHGEIS